MPIDNGDAALHEAGDLIAPLRAGVLAASTCVGLSALCRGEQQGRCSAADITVFKAVGTALADLVAASLVYRDLNGVD